MKKIEVWVCSCILLICGLFLLAGCKDKSEGGQLSETSMESSETRIRHVSIRDASIEEIPNWTYMGRAIEPAPKLYYNERILVVGEDYKMEYYDNVLPGEATLRISGIGNYTGIVDYQYSILLDDSYCDDISNVKALLFVEDTYRIFFNRLPSRDELVQGTKELGMQKSTVHEFLELIIQSEEFVSLAVGDIATVEKVYTLICERTLTEDERTYYATKLQEENNTLLSLLKDEFASEKFDSFCKARGLLSIKLDFSENELIDALNNACKDQWIGEPIFADFNGDGHLEAVREATHPETDGDLFYFVYVDGIHNYVFGQAKRSNHTNTYTWLLENDGGLSFAVTSVWKVDATDPDLYLSQVFKLDRTGFSTQLSREYTRILNPQKNSIDIEFFADEKRTDEQGNPIAPQTATLHYSEGKYN